MNTKQHNIVKLLAKGYTQKEVGEELVKMGYASVSLSTIEKLLAELRKQYQAKSTIQLFVILAKRGIL